MKSERAIRCELKRVEAMIKSREHGANGEAELYGAQQALAWAIGEPVMIPSKAFRLISEQIAWRASSVR